MANLGQVLFLPLCLSLLIALGSCDETTTEKSEKSEKTPTYSELELNPSQNKSFEKFKASVSSSAPHAYMKKDIYLVKFLLGAGFDVSKATTSFNNMLKWRKDNDVDSWPTTNKFDEFVESYQLIVNSWDKAGRPDYESPHGKWDNQGASLRGKQAALAQYAMRGTELCAIKIREQQAKGINVTTWNMLLQMEGFGPQSYTCLNCMTVYTDYVNVLEKYYPYSLNEIVLVQTPSTFQTLYKLLIPLLSKRTQEKIKIFGNEKSKWKPYVDNMVAEDQLADWFDGKKATPAGKAKSGGLLG